MVFGRRRETPEGWEALARRVPFGSITVGRGGGCCVLPRLADDSLRPFEVGLGFGGQESLEWEAASASEAYATSDIPPHLLPTQGSYPLVLELSTWTRLVTRLGLVTLCKAEIGIPGQDL